MPAERQASVVIPQHRVCSMQVLLTYDDVMSGGAAMSNRGPTPTERSSTPCLNSDSPIAVISSALDPSPRAADAATLMRHIAAAAAEAALEGHVRPVPGWLAAQANEGRQGDATEQYQHMLSCPDAAIAVVTLQLHIVVDTRRGSEACSESACAMAEAEAVRGLRGEEDTT